MFHRRIAWIGPAVALAIGFEVFLNVPWLGRIVSMAVVYDGTVLVMVALRAAVTALQTSAAWMLWQRLPAGPRFGQCALGASAVVLALELGFRLAPSSVFVDFRWPLVAVYAVYAGMSIWLLRVLQEHR